MEIEPYWNVELHNLHVRNELVVQYIPLLSHVARLLWGKKIARRVGSYEDLVASGYESLIRAAELYNPNHVSLASVKTYIYRSVLRAMLRAADEAGVIRIPASTLRAVRAPTAKTKPQSKEVCRSVNAVLSMTSLPSDYDAFVDDESSNEMWKEDIRQMTSVLPHDVREAVTRSFGLDCAPESMAKIGKSEGVTGQAIRQRRKHGLDTIGKRLMQDGITKDEFKY